MSLSRPTARRFVRKFGCTAGTTVTLLGLSAAPALAKKDVVSVVKQAPGAVNAVLAVCPGQTFSKPFEALGDVNYYTLVEGSEFTNGAEGWELYGGAHVVAATHPDGSTGSALDLPGGSVAVSPPVCVTLQYPTARIWTNGVQGDSSVVVSVAYANTKTASKPKQVGAIQEEQSGQHEDSRSGWALSESFNVQPELGGKTEETRQVRFIFAADGKDGNSSDTQLFGLYVDPRMR